MIKEKPWIAYVLPISFPEGGAAARRVLGNAKALVAAGYDVVIVSGQPPGVGGTEFAVEPGICCVSVNERDSEHLPNSLRYFRYATMGARSRRWLEAQPHPPCAVFLYSGYTPYLLQLRPWARRERVPLIFDAVEWYTASTFFRFLLSPYLWQAEFAMRVLIPRVDGVVAISRALDTYYRGKGLPVSRVPPLFDPTEITVSAPVSDGKQKLRLVYSGSPGRKDLIDIVIEAVIEHDAGERKLLLDIVGLSTEELRNRPPLRRRGGCIPDSLCAHGRVSHARSMNIIGQADFTVFLRNIDRVSTHGFPTKFVESLAVGTPVITNLTSDLCEHLRDGETGLICENPTKTALSASLDRALALNIESIKNMRNNAREEAEASFSYSKHVVSLRDIIEVCRDKQSE